MAATATDILSRIAELSDNASIAFCEDIGGMFGVEMQCERKKTETTTVRVLRDRFKKLSVAHLAKADGALNGTFHLVFDQGGLFILSGVIVMLPESRIIEDAKRGSLEDATNLQDAAREVGNLLVGSWDRIFREECPGHGHFVKTSTILGKLWEKPEQVELEANTEVALVTYEMTIESYPTFTCAAVFPTTVLNGFGEERPAEAAHEPSDTPSAPTKSSQEPVKTPDPVPAPKPAEPAVRAKPAPENVPDPAPAPPAPEPVAVAKPTPESPKSPENPQPAKSSDAPVVHEPVRESQVPQEGPSYLPPGRRSPLIDASKLPSELASNKSAGLNASAPAAGFAFLDAAYIQSQPQSGLSEFLNLPASEIMEKEVVWTGPEDTVQDVIAKMQQHNVGYVLVGVDGALEGLVSGSNVLGAVSLYLRPMFAKWHRPQDDATLGVKVKWIMSRPVRTIRPDATVAAMIEVMRRCGGRCLPVVDAKGTVQGIVTVFDILLRILESDKGISFKGRPPQAPPLLI